MVLICYYMIENLKAKNLNALKVCELTNLGKINIVCGKNNSGKSTVLKAINKLETRSFGKELIDDEIELIIGESGHSISGGTSLRPNNIYRNNGVLLGEQCRQVTKQVFKSKPIWYLDDINYFNNLFDKLWKEDEHRGQYQVSRNIQTAYNQVIGIEKVSSVLIPPKRELEITAEISSNENAHPSGKGVLNNLFKAKNRSIWITEKEKYLLLTDAFSQISDGYSFDISLEINNRIALHFSFGGKDWILADDCGLGLQDLVVILYFCIFSDFQLILLEEPESHLHPDMQRRLLRFIKERVDKQFFISTHSNTFLNTTLIDQVFFTQMTDVIKVEKATSRTQVLNALGYEVTDNLISDLIVLVEGPTDVPIIKCYIEQITDLSKFNIKIWPLGGDIMSQVDLTVFADSYKTLALIDNDPKSQSARKEFVANCTTCNIPLHILKRYSIENYFTVKALRAVFKGQIPNTIIDIDPDVKLFDQINIDVKKNNHKLAKEMKLEDIEGTDLYDFLMQVRKECLKLC